MNNMKIIFTVIISLLIFSCNKDPAKTVDPSKIIGQEIEWNELPYGKGALDGYKFINGIHYSVYCAEYKNRAIVYVYDDEGIIIDYFFSNAVRRRKAEKFPLGADYKEVVKKFGEPVFLTYPGIRYDFYKEDSGRFYCQYFRKNFNKISLKYELSQSMINFSFNGGGKLEKVISVWEWRP
jgi:hypothetical protein